METEKHLYLGINKLFSEKLGISNKDIPKEDREFHYLGELDSVSYSGFVPTYQHERGAVILFPCEGVIVLRGQKEPVVEARKSIEGGLEIKFFN